MSTVRPAAVAGRFYPASQSECLRMLDSLQRPVMVDGTPVGAIVPHAGWVFSGATAALGVAGLAHADAETVVIFGAVHAPDSSYASVFTGSAWETPLGRIDVDVELAKAFLRSPLIRDNSAAHRREHAIEVQLPLIQRLIGDVRIVPVAVGPSEKAAAVGRFCSAEVQRLGRRAVFLGSTDLTHYGPAYGFEPHGHGEEGVRWAKEVNDRRFVECVRRLDAEGVVGEASIHHNACGSGAVAATIAASQEAGANRYVELEHVTSAEKDVHAGMPQINSVGYEAGVFVRSS